MKKYNYLDVSSVVEELMAKKESDEIEFKSAAGGFPSSFWETYSSFANTNGGTIVLGVKEKAGNFYIDSLTDDLVEKWRTRQTLWRAVQMLTQKLCCQTIHDCPKVVPLHYESEWQ